MVMSEIIKSASLYTKIGVAFTILVGVLLLVVGAIFAAAAVAVIGIISLIVAVGAYVTTTMKLDMNDVEGAKGSCLIWGILLLIFGALIGGLFFILAHSKISEYSSRRIERPIDRPVIQPRTIEPATVPGPTIEPVTVPGGGGPQLANLFCKQGPGQGRNNPILGRNIEIARGKGSDIKLSDSSISRSHAQISYDGVNFYIEDMNSKNGTMVNGQRILPGERTQIENGAEIGVGSNTSLVFTKMGA